MAELVLPLSPLSSTPSSHPQLPTTSSQQMCQWRPTRGMPFEIQQHVRVYFEESLLLKALELLLSMVMSDASSQYNRITLPTSAHLELAATAVVHPSQTTRTTFEEKYSEANAALRLLRLVLKVIGPINAKLKEAFTFRKLYNKVNNNDVDTEIKHPYANQDSIWNRAEDFWAVVGWSLNCSCLPGIYASRWNYWRLWLDFMIDALEADWKYNLANKSVDQSLMWKYVDHLPGDTSHTRRIVRAIFANGSKTSLNEFREVFKHELKGPKQDGDRKEKREAVDIDNEIYGDYLQQDESDDSSENETFGTKRTSSRTARRTTPRTSRQNLQSDTEDDTTTSTTARGLGPPESITTRLRLMQLLVGIASQPRLTSSRTTNFPDLTDLFTLFVEFIRPLPLPEFHQLTSPSSTLTLATHTALLEFLLQRLLEHAPTTLDPTKPLTQDILVTTYLPYAANKSSIDANVRVSLCIEALLRDLANTSSLNRTENLQQAVERGVARRLGKVKDSKARAKAENDEDEAWCWLNESSARLRGVLRRLKT